MPTIASKPPLLQEDFGEGEWPVQWYAGKAARYMVDVEPVAGLISRLDPMRRLPCVARRARSAAIMFGSYVARLRAALAKRSAGRQVGELAGAGIEARAPCEQLTLAGSWRGVTESGDAFPERGDFDGKVRSTPGECPRSVFMQGTATFGVQVHPFELFEAGDAEQGVADGELVVHESEGLGRVHGDEP